MRPVIKIGWREVVAFPELQVTCMHAKIDTGARSSSIHAESINCYSKGSDPWISFKVMTNDTEGTLTECRMPVSDRRYVMNSGGTRELRYFVRTHLSISSFSWMIDLSLTTRHKLRYSVLIGREALGRRVIISPGRRYLAGTPTSTSIIK